LVLVRVEGSAYILHGEKGFPAREVDGKFFAPFPAHKHSADGRERGNNANGASIQGDGFAATEGEQEIDGISPTLLLDPDERAGLCGFCPVQKGRGEGIEAFEITAKAFGPFGQSPGEVGGFGGSSILGTFRPSFLVDGPLLGGALGGQKPLKLD